MRLTALAIPSLLVFEAEVATREHLQARCQELHLGREDAQLPLLGAARAPREADNVSPLELVHAPQEVARLVSQLSL